MALNIQTLKTRSLSAVVFVLLMAGGLLFSATSFVALFVIIHFGCWYEFVKLLKIIDQKTYWKYVGLGIIYITLPVLLLIAFRLEYLTLTIQANIDSLKYLVMPIFIIACMWVNDTMAYFVGSLIGKTPFSKISPKKTWEGTIGGALLCAVLMGWLGTLYGRNYLPASNHYFIAAGIAAVFGTLGDLVESKLKRMANVKDSGNIMPGHGGFLDRFDSLLIATPMVWGYVELFV
ncbi:MAG: phosphatidate cytidylyltransferase [Chitinophagaceae bacterium]